MFLCFSSFSKQISRSAEEGTPSSSSSSLTRFKATISPVSRASLSTLHRDDLAWCNYKVMIPEHCEPRRAITSGQSGSVNELNPKEMDRVGAAHHSETPCSRRSIQQRGKRE
ncbi:hypothetical protein TYRP_004574 [Tyrophagus putrescentiae]|nr:hypothetical protein TYRP_004574 [Tyrophagus putrescentiae]